MFPIRAKTRTLKQLSSGFCKLYIPFKCFSICPACSSEPNITKLIYIPRLVANFLSRQFPLSKSFLERIKRILPFLGSSASFKRDFDDFL